MEMLHIIYIGEGGSVRTIAEREYFEKVYKPKGWQIDKEFHEIPEDEDLKVIKELKEENKIKNYQKMRKTKSQQFDDGLIKKE